MQGAWIIYIYIYRYIVTYLNAGGMDNIYIYIVTYLNAGGMDYIYIYIVTYLNAGGMDNFKFLDKFTPESSNVRIKEVPYHPNSPSPC